MDGFIIILANLFFLLGLYFIPKYLYRYLIRKNIKSRYRLTLIFLAIGVLQVVTSALGYAVLPAYFLFLVYFMILAKFVSIFGFVANYEFIDFLFWVLLLSQAIAYSFFGFLLGILHEHYGTEDTELIS